MRQIKFLYSNRVKITLILGVFTVTDSIQFYGNAWVLSLRNFLNVLVGLWRQIYWIFVKFKRIFLVLFTINRTCLLPLYWPSNNKVIEINYVVMKLPTWKLIIPLEQISWSISKINYKNSIISITAFFPLLHKIQSQTMKSFNESFEYLLCTCRWNGSSWNGFSLQIYCMATYQKWFENFLREFSLWKSIMWATTEFHIWFLRAGGLQN